MVVVFLGPTPGTLELQPYETEDTELHEVQTVPGMIVVLRPDLMSHKHFSPGRSIAISSFFLTGHLLRRPPAEGWPMIPPARELDEWTMGRLKELKEQTQEDSAWDPEIPRDWQHAMNHIYHKGQMIAVRGTACRFPMCEDLDSFFQSSSSAPDFVTEVPLMRWDHSEVYDPDLESWRRFKSYCRHASFMDGIELFDCKMFSMSPNEAKSMDPHQRMILEVGYGALYHMGMRKNTLVNTACGVYVGCGNNEWSMMPKDADLGAFGATGGALSISSGRFSFTLGLKGPSMTLDTEASSGASAVYLASESVQRKGRAAANDYSLALGVNLVLAATWWPACCADGRFSAEGRCLTFNATAAGYVRGDGCASVALRCLAEYVDGDYVTNEEDPLVGAIAGAMMNNNGRGASLSSPSGPAEQEAVAEAVRNASISAFDVDAVEAHGAGAFLADAIEVGSLLRAHRSEDQREPLALLAVKSSMANQLETSGITSFLKTLYSTQWGVMTPSLHLKTANPHLDAFEQPCAFATDSLEYRMQSAFCGVMSRGLGGSNVYLLAWGQVNHDKVPPPRAPTLRDTLTFWPGGGGALASEQRPARAYTIVGSWSQWAEPATMEPEGDGLYSYTVQLGENRWEQFQIWLDGDASRALHPGEPRMPQGWPVRGPGLELEGGVEALRSGTAPTWIIDGRGGLAGYERRPGALLSLTEQPGEGAEALVDAESLTLGTTEAGQPGDQYRVLLQVTGKWRMVTWEKLPALEQALPPLVPPGTYYLAGSWSDWALEEMHSDPSSPGLFTAEVRLPAEGIGDFQVVRDRDWSQVFYPNPDAAMEEPDSVLGPDDLGFDLAWRMEGAPGDTFQVRFQRTHEAGVESRILLWQQAEQLADA